MAMTTPTTLVAYLTTLHQQRGRPSLRRIAASTGVNHQTIASALNGTVRTRWPTMELLVAYLGGDVAVALDLWNAPSTMPTQTSVRSMPIQVTLLTEIRDLLEELVNAQRLTRGETRTQGTGGVSCQTATVHGVGHNRIVVP